MPRIQTKVVGWYGGSVTSDVGTIEFDNGGVAEVTQEQYDVLCVPGSAFFDPEHPEGVPAPEGEAQAPEAAALGQSNEDFILGALRFMTDGAALQRIEAAVADRLMTLALTATGQPVPAKDAPAPEDAAEADSGLAPDGKPWEETSGGTKEPDPASDLADALSDSKVAEVIAILQTVDDPADLDLYDQTERAGKNRTSVLEAIEKRRAAVAPKAE